MKDQLIKLSEILFAEIHTLQKEGDAGPARGDVVARLAACLRDTLRLIHEID